MGAAGRSLWHCGLILLLQWILSSLPADTQGATLGPSAVQLLGLCGCVLLIPADPISVQPGLDCTTVRAIHTFTTGRAGGAW